MSDHLGAELAALVDGELDHASRERVLRHLTRCEACRAEVEAERLFKARLMGLGDAVPPPAPDLSARLRELASAGADDLTDLTAAAGPSRPGSYRATTAPRTPRGSRRPGGRSARRRAAVGGAVLALGLGAVLALGAPHSQPTRAPVDPTSDAFLVDYAGSTGELPLPEPAGVSSAGLGR